jgi:hypothetical protein
VAWYCRHFEGVKAAGLGCREGQSSYNPPRGRRKFCTPEQAIDAWEDFVDGEYARYQREHPGAVIPSGHPGGRPVGLILEMT